MPQDDSIIAEFDENTNSFNIIGSSKYMFGDLTRDEAIEHASKAGQNYIELFYATEDLDAKFQIVKELYFLDYIFQCFDNDTNEPFEDVKAYDYLEAAYTSFSVGFDKVKELFVNELQSNA